MISYVCSRINERKKKLFSNISKFFQQLENILETNILDFPSKFSELPFFIKKKIKKKARRRNQIFAFHVFYFVKRFLKSTWLALCWVNTSRFYNKCMLIAYKRRNTQVLASNLVIGKYKLWIEGTLYSMWNFEIRHGKSCLNKITLILPVWKFF